MADVNQAAEPGTIDSHRSVSSPLSSPVSISEPEPARASPGSATITSPEAGMARLRNPSPETKVTANPSTDDQISRDSKHERTLSKASSFAGSFRLRRCTNNSLGYRNESLDFGNFDNFWRNGEYGAMRTDSHEGDAFCTMPPSAFATSASMDMPPSTVSMAHSNSKAPTITKLPQPIAIVDKNNSTSPHSPSTEGLRNLRKRKAEDDDEGEDNGGQDEDSGAESDSPPIVGGAFTPMGNRKRHKCTPEQIEMLEEFFKTNQNPTGMIRQSLAMSLLMPERSVQIWFQNKRAKSRNKRYTPKGKNAAKSENGASGSKQVVKRRPNQLSDVPTAESVTVLPAYSLCVGSWRRVGFIICFFSRRLQNLTWYLQSESVGYKLEMPWSSVRSITFDGPFAPTVPEESEGVTGWIGHLALRFERSPTFFMEVFRSSGSALSAAEDAPGGQKRTTAWRQCADFTEGQQATSVMTHVIAGPYHELRAAVESLAKASPRFEMLVSFRDQAVNEQLKADPQSNPAYGASVGAPGESIASFDPHQQPVVRQRGAGLLNSPWILGVSTYDPRQQQQQQQWPGAPTPLHSDFDPQQFTSSMPPFSSTPSLVRMRSSSTSGPPLQFSTPSIDGWSAAPHPTANFLSSASGQSSYGASASLRDSYSVLQQNHSYPTPSVLAAGFSSSHAIHHHHDLHQPLVWPQMNDPRNSAAHLSAGASMQPSQFPANPSQQSHHFS